MRDRWVVVFVSAAAFLAACSSSGESEKGASTSSSETLKTYESQFDPTTYNPEPKTLLSSERPPSSEPQETAVALANPPIQELVQGFRVQIYASTSIDQAAERKQTAEELFPEEWFYLVYDPPTYKIRAGNFLTRFEADRFLKDLRNEGFIDSWIVPDKVRKDAPPRSAVREETDFPDSTGENQ